MSSTGRRRGDARETGCRCEMRNDWGVVAGFGPVRYPAAARDVVHCDLDTRWSMSNAY